MLFLFSTAFGPDAECTGSYHRRNSNENWFHYSDVIMDTMAYQITSLAIVYSPFIQAQIKENIKAPRHLPLCGEFTGDRWFPRIKGQWRGKCFHLMTSSCCLVRLKSLLTSIHSYYPTIIFTHTCTNSLYLTLNVQLMAIYQWHYVFNHFPD